MRLAGIIFDRMLWVAFVALVWVLELLVMQKLARLTTVFLQSWNPKGDRSCFDGHVREPPGGVKGNIQRPQIQADRFAPEEDARHPPRPYT